MGARRAGLMVLAVTAAACGAGSHVAAPRPSTTTASTTPPPPISTTVAAPGTTAAPPTVTTGHRLVTTTTGTPTTIPGPPVTTYADPGLPQCASGNLTATAHTDAPSYRRGAAVGLSVTVKNTGPSTCEYQPSPGPGDQIKVTTPSGAPVWQPAPLPGVYARPPYYELPAGASFVAATETWDQHACTSPCFNGEGAEVASGQYEAVAQVAGVGKSVNAGFTIT